MDLPAIKPLKAPVYWNRPTTKRYGLRTDDVHRLYGDSYREYKNNKMELQAQSFVESKKSYDIGNMPSSWAGQYAEPKFLTNDYISMRRPISSRDRAPPPTPRPSTNMGISLPVTSTLSSSSSRYSAKYDSRYLGGVRSSQIGLSSDSYYRLESKF